MALCLSNLFKCLSINTIPWSKIKYKSFCRTVFTEISLGNIFMWLFFSYGWANVFFLFLSLFVFERQQEHTCMSRGAAERQRESQAGSILSAQSLMWGSKSWTVRSWRELKSRVRRLTDCPTWVTLQKHLKTTNPKSMVSV